MRKLLMVAAAASVLASPAFAAGVTDKEIVIGTSTDLSGVTVEWGVNNTNGIRMAFEEQNAKGGINGRMIKYIVEDSQYQVPRHVQAVNKLINRDHVFLMIGNGGTPMNNATIPTQIEKNVPNMFPLTSARSLYMPLNKLKFGLGSSYYDQIRAGLKYFIAEKGKKRVCAASQDTDFGRDVMDGVRDQLKAMNESLAAETSHKPTDTDFSAAAAKLRHAKCDLVVLGTVVRETIGAMAEAKKLGWDVKFLGATPTNVLEVPVLGKDTVEGLYAAAAFEVPYEDTAKGKVKDWLVAYKKAYGSDANTQAIIGYNAIMTFAFYAKEAGKDLTGQKFLDAMESGKPFDDIFGNPTTKFSKTNHLASTVTQVQKVEKGRWVVVKGGLMF